jgi:hypothetical protein
VVSAQLGVFGLISISTGFLSSAVSARARTSCGDCILEETTASSLSWIFERTLALEAGVCVRARDRGLGRRGCICLSDPTLLMRERQSRCCGQSVWGAYDFLRR